MEGLAHVVHDDSFGLMRSAVAIANDAREKVGASQSSTNRSPLIALSLGPYAASLGGGAEYRNPTEASSEDLRFFHRRRAHVFFANTDVPQSKDAKTFPDVVAYETFNSAREAVIVTEIMRTDLALAALPFWITFHCSTDGLIASGETLKDAVDQILVANNSNPYLIGIGVNCCQPQKLNFLVGEIRRAIEEAVNMSSTELPELYTFAYPNSGEEWIEDMDGGAGGGRYVWPGNQPISEAEWAQFVLNSGADFVGGCCRCGASHVCSVYSASPFLPVLRTLLHSRLFSVERRLTFSFVSFSTIYFQIASLAAAVREKLCQEH